jgi:hypothetical protein
VGHPIASSMEGKPTITLGPFFMPAHVAQPENSQIVSLNLVMEWSNSNQAMRIPLFRRLLPYAPNRLQLEHIVFRHCDLPCDMECQEYQAIETPEGSFLPLDGLLAALYVSCEISRPAFQALNDLASALPLDGTLTNTIATKGLLASEAEARGFRLNAVFQESEMIYAHIAWEPESRSTRFHVCLATFQPGHTLKLGAAKWMVQREIGVSKILAEELHRLVPGNPTDLLSEAGVHFLGMKLLWSPHETDSHQ